MRYADWTADDEWVCLGADELVAPAFRDEVAIYTDCVECGAAIKHRWTAPVAPRKLCRRCGEGLLHLDESLPEDPA